MDDLSFARHFRLRPGGIECDAEGLRVGGVALLARDAKGAWGRRDERDLSRELSKRYGFPLDIERKRKGVDAVAAALANGDSPAPRSPRCCCNFPTLPHLRAFTLTGCRSDVSPLTSPPAGF